MNSELSCNIRWRWFFAGVGVVAASLLILWGLHSIQMPRIANRVLKEARDLMPRATSMVRVVATATTCNCDLVISMRVKSTLAWFFDHLPQWVKLARMRWR